MHAVGLLEYELHLLDVVSDSEGGVADALSPRLQLRL